MPTKRIYLLIIPLYIIITGTGCNTGGLEYKLSSKVNPAEINPLAAIIKVEADKPCRASYKVLGETEIEQTFSAESEVLDIPIVGLYPNKTNKILLSLTYAGGTVTDTIDLKTGPLPLGFPEIEINKINRAKMAPGLHAVDFHFAQGGKYYSCPIIFDDQGQIRWLLNLAFNGKMAGPFQQLSNGRIMMAGRHIIYEFDMLGRIMKKSEVPNNYGIHHDIAVLPNGDYLLAVGKRDSRMVVEGETMKSDNDWIALWDNKKGMISKEWDLAKHLDVNRHDLNLFRKVDWLHMNGLFFNEKDSTIIISNKNQGLCEITWDDKLNWILSPHKNWGMAGRKSEGPDTKPYLLTAIDQNNKPYPNEVQQGTKSADDFDFAWGNHAPSLLPNGNLIVFDNGSHRNFIETPTYSRAVEYEINKTDLTVKQKWQYGKERKGSFFSSIISDVDYIESHENMLITSGFIYPKEDRHGKIVEVDKVSGEVLFEAKISYKDANGSDKPGWGQRDIAYRSERMLLQY